MIEFKGAEGQAYLAKAYEAAWAGIIKQSPEHGPKLQGVFLQSEVIGRGNRTGKDADAARVSEPSGASSTG